MQSNYLTSKSNTNAIFKSNINYQHFNHSSIVNQSKQVPAAAVLEACLLRRKIRILGLFNEKNEVFLPSEVFGLFGLIGLRKTSLEDLADFANLGSFVEVPLLSTNGTIECGAPSSSEFGVQLMA